MSKNRLFDLPLAAHNSTEGARRAYHTMWGWDWPHDDAYLRELAKRVPSSNALVTDGGNITSRCEFLLMLMRENDDDAAAGRVSNAPPTS